MQHQEIRKSLIAKKTELESRLTRLDAHAKEELEKDSEERALQIENDEVMESLSSEGQAELSLVLRALERLDLGTFGQCVECGDEIPEARLVAMPFAERCIQCAR